MENEKNILLLFKQFNEKYRSKICRCRKLSDFSEMYDALMHREGLKGFIVPLSNKNSFIDNMSAVKLSPQNCWESTGTLIEECRAWKE